MKRTAFYVLIDGVFIIFRQDIVHGGLYLSPVKTAAHVTVLHGVLDD
ncbi:hypothetical protein O8413_11630 [Vibrio furnissii]|nr:hypothetical protein [Vibrio furnissii]WHR50689.1 hypothetical protein O8413_11630 [Vibrio furnissii]